MNYQYDILALFFLDASVPHLLVNEGVLCSLCAVSFQHSKFWGLLILLFCFAGITGL